MKASQTGLTGSRGQDAVGEKFLRFNWEVAPNPAEHDLGTDLWLMARDSRRFDLGALVGAQVKAGDSWFDSPERDSDGQTTGGPVGGQRVGGRRVGGRRTILRQDRPRHALLTPPAEHSHQPPVAAGRPRQPARTQRTTATPEHQAQRAAIRSRRRTGLPRRRLHPNRRNRHSP
jgi:hypothetical protein